MPDLFRLCQLNRRQFSAGALAAVGVLVSRGDARLARHGLAAAERASGAAAAQPLAIARPLPYEVFQRDGFAPGRAYENAPGGPVLGHADVTLHGRFADPAGPQPTRWEYRIELLEGAWGSASQWSRLAVAATESDWQATIRVPAGGWYQVTVRALDPQDQPLASGTAGPFGVGERFVIAGQSYAAGANDELQQIEDPQGRVAACDVRAQRWQIAHDPQPNVGDGGTIWPAFANLLLPLIRVPVGLINVAVGGTSSRQWLPGGPLCTELQGVAQRVGRFRYLLWQQGESDVIEGTPAETYIQNLVTIRDHVTRQWGFSPPWLLAKSTLHPTVYRKPQEEAVIRQAIDALTRQSGFYPGPDTDLLGAENRGGLQTRRHFSPIGQRRAGLLWFTAVWNMLHRSELPA